MAKLSKGEIVTIQVLTERGESACSIARTLGVTEGAIRHHRRRMVRGAEDGRRRKATLVEKAGLSDVARRWWCDRQAGLPADRPPSVEALHRFLVEEHDFRGSYKPVRKFARREFPLPKLRPYRRIETPPGAQAQVDWFGPRMVDLGGESREPLIGFLMVLAHSRMAALVWSRSTDQLAWHHCHVEAFRRLGGVAAVLRIDNLRTGVAQGAGPWSEINASYQRFAKSLGFHVDPHEAYCPRSKGKVERLVRIAEGIGPGDLRFDSLEHLQEWSDARMLASASRRRCAATGLSVLDSWHAERRLLRGLPETVGIVFDVSVRRPVHLDCTVRRRVRTALRLSGLPTGQTISNFDFAFQPSIERGRVEALSTCGWIRERQSLLILGPPGVGKTHLAVALGVRAVESGFSVAFYRVEELLAAMRQDAARHPARLKRAKYMKPALLIVDEMGFEAFSREEAALFFRLVSHRYGRGAMCSTSNKAISEWPEMLAGDEVITAAILDRLLHASCVLHVKGRSYRLRDLEESIRAR